MTTRKLIVSTFCLCIGALTACVGGEPDSVHASQQALDLPSTSREIPESVWALAPAGCEGLLGHGDVELVGTSGIPDLRAIIAGDEVVCVDTIDSIGQEITALRREAIDTAVADTHLIFSAARFYVHNEEVSGDPSPQPDMPTRGGPGAMNGPDIAAGDPSPQPDQPNGGHGPITYFSKLDDFRL